MNSEDLKSATSKDDKVSPAEEEIDKKFVSQAVAFVIGHTRNGFVALCASVATLLKEQAKLKLENESLRQQISELLRKTPAESDPRCALSQNSRNDLPVSKEMFHTEVSTQYKFKRKKGYKALRGCLCNSCVNAAEPTTALSTPLKKGERVIISGELCGTVCYVGHVETLSFPEIFIGLYLDEAVGDTNGRVGDKRYFSVPQGYGLFAPLWNVCCIID